jgi:hypothetical protein
VRRRERKALSPRSFLQYDPGPNGPLAQLAEQQTLNLRVEGSIPSRLTILPTSLSSSTMEVFQRKWRNWYTR